MKNIIINYITFSFSSSFSLPPWRKGFLPFLYPLSHPRTTSSLANSRRMSNFLPPYSLWLGSYSILISISQLLYPVPHQLWLFLQLNEESIRMFFSLGLKDTLTSFHRVGEEVPHHFVEHELRVFLLQKRLLSLHLWLFLNDL